MRRGVGGVAFVVLAALIGASCGGDTATTRGAIEVRLEDFLLHVSSSSTPSGNVTLYLNNEGPSTHELNVDRTELAADDLPLRTDGLSVQEDSAKLKRIGSVEILEAGDHKNFKLTLPPGHYVLYCNLEGHYLGKMYATLDVH